MNTKQLKYSRKKVRKALMQARLRLFLFVMVIFAIPAALSAITDTDKAREPIAIVAGTSFASMMAIGNIEDVPDKDVAGEALSYKVWLIDYNQLDHSASFPRPNASRELGAIPLKKGQRPHYFVAHDIPQFTSSGERGDLTITATNTFTIIMGGVRDQLLNFIEQYAGGKFIIIFQECGNDSLYVVGTPCKPMILKTFSLKNDKENRSVTFTFENKSILQYLKYTGSVAQEPPTKLTAGATELKIKPGVDTYIVPEGTSASYAIATVSGLTPSDEGRYITLIGEGATNAATIAESAHFSLKGGATWTAKEGSQITFKVFDESTLTEVSRV